MPYLTLLLTSWPGRAPESSRGKAPFGLYLRLWALWLGLVNYRWLLLLVLVAAVYLRAGNPNYSSAFMDESIYLLYGGMFLTRHFEAPLDQPLQHSFGWYLWPVLASTADRIAGLVGVRELGALFGVITVLAVFGFARQLFSLAVGLASAAGFALLGPAVFASRIATRDTGTICFFALGLWLFARAWRKDDAAWFAAAVCFFGAFLCKYLVVIYFPFLVLLSLRRGHRSVAWFGIPLTIFCAVYGIYYARDLEALLRYALGYSALKAPPGEAWKIYFANRADFWILLGLSALAVVPEKGASMWIRAWLLFGAALLPLFQLFSRADYDYWKHVNYSFLFLLPLAMYGLVRWIRRWTGAFASLVGALAVGLLSVTLGWLGNAWHLDRFLFWPNVEPTRAYLEGRLAPNSWLLVDDTSLRYYFHPLLQQWQIVDPFYFHYNNATGAPAYAAAVRDGLFDFVALDGGMGADARQMRAAIESDLPGRYVLKFSMLDPVLSQPIQIYQRKSPPAALPTPAASRVEILSPGNGALVKTQGETTQLEGVATDAGPGWYVRVAVFTNRWYPQGEKIFLQSGNDTFRQIIHLGGRTKQQCYHLIRAQLYDQSGRLAATAVNFGIARANSDGSAPVCRQQETTPK